MSRQELLFQYESLLLDVSRVMMTDDARELCLAYDFACKRLERLKNERYQKLNGDET